jgi:hypothetical protein
MRAAPHTGRPLAALLLRPSLVQPRKRRRERMSLLTGFVKKRRHLSPSSSQPHPHSQAVESLPRSPFHFLSTLFNHGSPGTSPIFCARPHPSRVAELPFFNLVGDRGGTRRVRRGASEEVVVCRVTTARIAQHRARPPNNSAHPLRGRAGRVPGPHPASVDVWGPTLAAVREAGGHCARLKRVRPAPGRGCRRTAQRKNALRCLVFVPSPLARSAHHSRRSCHGRPGRARDRGPVERPGPRVGGKAAVWETPQKAACSC